MINAQQAANISSRNTNGTIAMTVEDAIIAAAQRGEYEASYVNLDQASQLELANEGYELEFLVTKGMPTTKISWKPKYI